MRIMFFPKLIVCEETKIHTLKNCRVVIDGHNFFYSSYQDSNLPYVYGSEANEHAKFIRKQLNMFRNANVECYFVFKGGDTDIDKKIQRVNANYEKEPNDRNVLPIFTKEIYKQVLDEVGIKYATCMFESKEDCVALAQAFNCSVISNDIEYCFKGAPYIPSTSLEYSAQRQEISCKQYHIMTFLQKYSLTKKKLALFAALSDTNVFELNHFRNLLQQWNVIHQNLCVQIKKLLKWLSEHTEEETLNEVLQFLTDESEKQKLLSQLNKVLTTMDQDQSDVVATHLKNLSRCNYNDIDISKCDPKWFEKGVAIQKIAIQYINLYSNKCIIGAFADIKPKSEYDCLRFSIDIIIYAYNLLNNFKSTEITVYHKYNSSLKFNTEDNSRKPKYQCKESVFENGWEHIKQLKLFEHFLESNDIKIDLLNTLPVEARMLFITLAYFARKKTSANVLVTKEIYSFIVSYVLLHVVFDKRESHRKKRSNLNEDDCSDAIFVTKKYFRCGKVDVIDDKAITILYELQYCLLHMNYLNSLCGSPFMTTKYHRTFNGTFIYKLWEDMNGRDEKEFLAELFKTAPSVLSFINNLINTYEQLL